MIVPGKSVESIKIGDKISLYPDAKIKSNLSLNQKLFELGNGIKVRTNSKNKLNWILIDNDQINYYFESIKIGASFDTLIEKYDLIYDEDEGYFKVHQIDGFCFSFGQDNLDSIIMLNKKIEFLIVYNVNMDSDNSYFFDTLITKNNLHFYSK